MFWRYYNILHQHQIFTISEMVKFKIELNLEICNLFKFQVLLKLKMLVMIFFEMITNLY